MSPLVSHSGPGPTVVETRRPVLICLLGAFKVLRGAQSVPARVVGKQEALLTCLALRRDGPVRRDELLEALWPSTEPTLAGQSLNTLVYGLHKLLGDAIGDQPVILNTDGWYRLNTEAGIHTDVERFEALVQAGDDAVRAGNTGQTAKLYGEAIEIYRGDLCVGATTASIVLREHLRATYLTVLAHVADYHFDHADYASCLSVAARLLDKDPCREDGHRLVMRCYVRLGERAQALRQYRVCESILRSEFDVAPEPETVALFDQVRLAPAKL